MDTKSKIHTVNTLLSWLCLGLVIALPMFVLTFWIDFESAAPSLNARLEGRLQIDTIQTWQIASAAAFSMLSTLVFVRALWHLRLLFNGFKNAEFFTANNTQNLYIVSKMLLLSVLLNCLSSAVLSVLLTWNNGPNQKALIVSLGSDELWMLVVAATFLTIAWTFNEGQNLAQENAAFI